MRAKILSAYDRPYALLILATLFWSGNFVLARAVRADVPPVGLAFWRWVVGFAIVAGFAWPHLQRDLPVIRRHWRIMLVFSALGIAAFNTLVYIGLHWTTTINAVLMQSSMPVVIVLMSFMLFGERISRTQSLGVFASLCGAVTIVARGDWSILTALALNRGDVWVVCAVFCYAAYSALLRRRPPVHALTFVAVTFLAGALMLSPLYAWEIAHGTPMHLDRVTVLSVAYVAVFPSILSYLFFNRGVELIGANRAGLFIHLMPVFGSIMAVAFLGEVFRAYHAAGIGLILAGIVLAQRVDPRRTPAARPPYR